MSLHKIRFTYAPKGKHLSEKNLSPIDYFVITPTLNRQYKGVKPTV